MTKLFLSVEAQYSNLGDFIIRRTAWDLLQRQGGRPFVLARRSPPGWLEDLGVDAVTYRSQWRWLAAMLAPSRQRKVLVLAPGEYALTGKAAPHELVHLVLATIGRLTGLRVVRLPRSVRTENTAATLLHRLAARASRLAMWRDPVSAEAMGGSPAVPDVAFARRGEPQDRERDRLTVSVRGDRRNFTQRGLETWKKLADAIGLEIAVCSQVEMDDRCAEEIARSLGAVEVVLHGGRSSVDVERSVVDLYSRSALVVSDRLHVVVLALVGGAHALTLTAAKSTKLENALTPVGLEHLVTTETAFDVVDYVAGFEQQRLEVRKRVEQAHDDALRALERAARVIGGARGRVLVLQLAMGAYRQRFLTELSERLGDESHDAIQFLVGDLAFGAEVRTDVSSLLVSRTRPNLFLLNRRVVFQRGVLRRALLAREVIVELNPRVLSSWLVLVVRRLSGRPTTGWGHVHARSGEEKWTNAVRRFMQGLCTDLIAYTRSEAEVARRAHPGVNVMAANNALYSREFLDTEVAAEERRHLLVIGRLTPEKKPDLAVEIFARALPDLPPDTRLLLVGAGPRRDGLGQLVERLGVAHRVDLLGEITDPIELRGLFATCRACLSGGYLGLNAIQSLGFGVPIIYPRDDPHAPEIDSLHDGNGLAYTSDDVASGAERVLELFAGAALMEGEDMIREIRENYTTDLMVAPFVNILERSR